MKFHGDSLLGLGCWGGNMELLGLVKLRLFDC